MASSAYDTAPASAYDRARGQGWLVFASVMLGLAGTWNFLDGLLAVGKSKVYAGGEAFIFSDLRTWGWIVLGLGVLQLVAAFGVMTGSEASRWFAVAVAGVNGIGQL